MKFDSFPMLQSRLSVSCVCRFLFFFFFVPTLVLCTARRCYARQWFPKHRKNCSLPLHDRHWDYRASRKHLFCADERQWVTCTWSHAEASNGIPGLRTSIQIDLSKPFVSLIFPMEQLSILSYANLFWSQYRIANIERFNLRICQVFNRDVLRIWIQNQTYFLLLPHQERWGLIR